MAKAYSTETGEIQSSHDRFPFFWRKWVPTSGAGKRTLIVQHGFGEHSGRYENLVETLAGTGTTIYALDSRGHGRTGGKRGHVDQFQFYIDDLADLIELARHETRSKKIFLLGHSLGGVIVLQYATQGTNQRHIQGLVTSAPGLRPVLDFSKRVKKVVGGMLAGITPAATVDANLDLNFLTHDRQVIEAYLADPLVHGKVSFQMATNFFKLDKAILEKAHTIHVPTLVFHGDADGIVDVSGSKDLYANLGSEDKTLKLYEGLFHETMNEEPAERERVLEDLKAWLLAH